MKEKEIANNCIFTTKTIKVVYDTKWKGGMQRTKSKLPPKNVGY